MLVRTYECNALTNPGAMVIKFLNTVITYSTVATPGWTINLANPTIFEFLFHPINGYPPPPCAIASTNIFSGFLIISRNNSRIN